MNDLVSDQMLPTFVGVATNIAPEPPQPQVEFFEVPIVLAKFGVRLPTLTMINPIDHLGWRYLQLGHWGWLGIFIFIHV